MPAIPSGTSAPEGRRSCSAPRTPAISSTASRAARRCRLLRMRRQCADAESRLLLPCAPVSAIRRRRRGGPDVAHGQARLRRLVPGFLGLFRRQGRPDGRAPGQPRRDPAGHRHQLVLRPSGRHAGGHRADRQRLRRALRDHGRGRPPSGRQGARQEGGHVEHRHPPRWPEGLRQLDHPLHQLDHHRFPRLLPDPGRPAAGGRVDADDRHPALRRRGRLRRMGRDCPARGCGGRRCGARQDHGRLVAIHGRDQGRHAQNPDTGRSDRVRDGTLRMDRSIECVSVIDT